MAESRLLKIRLSLKGRPIKAFVFDQECVLVGRNPEADIFLDNPGISRDHLKIERSTTGYQVVDLNSANGTFLNDRPVQRSYLGHEDVIRIGKFSLWVSLEADRRGSHPNGGAFPVAFEGTTVLRTGELEEMMHTVRELDHSPPEDPTPKPEPIPAATRRQWRNRALLAAAAGLCWGTAIGAGTVYYLFRIVTR